jgi:hypothetical protein
MLAWCYANFSCRQVPRPNTAEMGRAVLCICILYLYDGVLKIQACLFFRNLRAESLKVQRESGLGAAVLRSVPLLFLLLSGDVLLDIRPLLDRPIDQDD